MRRRYKLLAAAVVVLAGLIGTVVSSGASVDPSLRVPARTGQAVEAPKIPFKPLGYRGQYSITIWIPLVLSKSVRLRLFSDRAPQSPYTCSGKVPGLPQTTFRPEGFTNKAAGMKAYMNQHGKKLPAAVKQQWVNFGTQPDTYVTLCSANWDTTAGAKGKVVSGTFAVGGKNGVPVVRRSFAFGPLCDWYQPSCQTLGMQPAR